MVNDYYETSDLGCAVALLATGLRLERIEKSNPRRAVFIFHDLPKARQLEAAYWDKTLEVSALHYHECMKQLKTRLYS